jgi:hypothetical protein
MSAAAYPNTPASSPSATGAGANASVPGLASAGSGSGSGSGSSAAAGTCALDTSPSQMHLVVMASGRIIWDLADCAKSGQTQQAKLARGVPVQQGFTWNRSVTLPGCSTLASSAKAGTYTAQAKAGSVTSPVRTFKLAD